MYFSFFSSCEHYDQQIPLPTLKACLLIPYFLVLCPLCPSSHYSSWSPQSSPAAAFISASLARGQLKVYAKDKRLTAACDMYLHFKAKRLVCTVDTIERWTQTCDCCGLQQLVSPSVCTDGSFTVPFTPSPLPLEPPSLLVQDVDIRRDYMSAFYKYSLPL